ncbi:coiled-coil domain-containing protein [Faecalibacter rhinopitheci]|uniref:Uncharacterized protein n=1 Tax=Faecalibacter rhinopitheci TaxID=2779678 RepID=A0A8J7FQ76_9FLAO|nr:hypothetical protein [Faecalibacter rhinopitheci]MBF0597584.1 hypothetical protein [Faecalibacter rhinopitheci]
MKQKEYIEIDNKPTFSKNMIILLLSIALLGTVGYNLYMKQQHNKILGIDNATINDLERSREILKQELRITRSDYDTAKTQILDKDVDLQEKDRKIFEKQKKIQNILNQQTISKEDLSTAKRLIVSLKTELGEYKRQIEVLKIQNAKLKNENTQLAEVNQEVTDKNISISKNLEIAHTENEAQKANVNATLAISNYNLSGVKVRNSGKEVETDKASRINKLRVSFDVDSNANSIAEKKELFVAIYKPDGTLGKFEGANPGKIPLRSGANVEFSDRVSFDYDPKSGNKISFDWKDYNFPKGEYKIDIYQNGFKIAQNKILLK